MSVHLSARTVERMSQAAARLRRTIERRDAAAFQTASARMEEYRDAKAKLAEADIDLKLAAISLLCAVEVEIVEESGDADEMGGAA